MKRVLWWALACLLAAAMFSACGGDDDDDSGGAAGDDDNDDNDNDDAADDDNDDADDDDNDDADDDDNDDADDDDDDDNDDDDLPAWLEIPAGQMTIRIQTDPYYLEVQGPDSQVLLATPQDKSRAINISPMPYLPHAFQVGEFGEWYYAKKAIAFDDSGSPILVTVRAVDATTETKEATIALAFTVEADDHLTFTATASGVDGVKNHTGAYALESDEHFFGLGLQYDAIDQRGKARTMFVGLGVDLTDQIQNHAPMPFYFSSRGYGLFVEDKGRGYFDMGRDDHSAYGYKYHTDALKTHVFWGPQPLKIIESYTGLTGRPPMNPDYLFGHLHWRNVNNSETEMYSDIDALRAHGIPTSSFMVDAPWSTAYQTWQFNECPSGCQFVDAQAVIDYAHDKGFAFYLWTAEFMNKTSPVEAPGQIEDNSALFDYAKDNDYLVCALGFWCEIPWWHDNGAMLNFLNPDAYDWVQSLVANVMAMGVQGFKMDGGEYVGADTLGVWPLGVFDTGEWGDPQTDQYYYKWMYHQLFWEMAQDYNGPLGVATVRTAVWGEQTHVNYFWPGDMEHSWGTDLGLPADVIGGLTLSTAGFPYYGSNDGGFSGYDPDDPELLARWTAASAFRPIFESPKNGAQEVWEAYPAGTEEMYRKYALIHTRLFPYMKAYAQEAVDHGYPIMRMLPLMYLDDTETYGRNFDYLLGDSLLVEPVVEQGATTRDVYFPEGQWVNYWNGEAHTGPAHFTEAAPQDEIPVYAKAGAIIPLLDPSIETLWPTDDPDVVDHEDVADLLWVDVFPSTGLATSFNLVDGTSLGLSEAGGTVTFNVSGSPPLERLYSWRLATALVGGAAPSQVDGPSGTLTEFDNYDDWNAATAGWFYDAALGNLWVRDYCGTDPFTAYF